MAIQIKVGGVWKAPKTFIKVGGVWKQVYSPVTVTFPSGTYESSGTTVSTVIGPFNITVTGGTASAYNWSVAGDGTGSATISSGQGTATAYVRLNGVPSGESATAYLSATCTVDGTIYRSGEFDIFISYYRYI